MALLHLCFHGTRASMVFVFPWPLCSIGPYMVQWSLRSYGRYVPMTLMLPCMTIMFPWPLCSLCPCVLRPWRPFRELKTNVVSKCCWCWWFFRLLVIVMLVVIVDVVRLFSEDDDDGCCLVMMWNRFYSNYALVMMLAEDVRWWCRHDYQFIMLAVW